MSTKGTQLTFAELLTRHRCIQVPLIQRDYAQGRTDQMEVREEFLGALYEALRRPPSSPDLPLNLDFIYGSVEGQAPGSFLPLDGQQRLTTLFLLHWYLAWKDGRKEEFRTLCSDGVASRFTYHVRPSSSEFFDALAVFSPLQSAEEVSLVSALLADQPWYFRNWRLDPTIQSALVMLDAIHARFQKQSGLYARLTDVDRPAITFQLLDLRHFGLSDDLYIKMNARGKPLTPFETFKARYEQKLKSLFSGESRLLDGQSVSVAEYFARRMDTRWADFFWPHRNPVSNLSDETVMNVFRALIVITRSPRSDQFIEDINQLRDPSRKNSYSFFHERDWLDRSFSELLIVLLEIWSAVGVGSVTLLPGNRHFNEEAMFRKIVSNPTTLSFEEIVQLVAYAQFLKVQGDNLDKNAFQEWMRVVFNLSVNTEYNRSADLQRSVAAIGELEPHMNSIMDYLARVESDIGGFNKQQVSEEKIKAQLLLTDKGWRPVLDRAEAHPYFRGQIGFLLKFCGIGMHSASCSEQTGGLDATHSLQAAFSNVLQKAAAMFDSNGLSSLPRFRWERALLAIGDYLLPARRNHSFLVNDRDDQASWKRLLRGAGIGSPQGEVLRTLWENLLGPDKLEAQLDALILAASECEEWRRALLDEPKALEYCRQRMIRRSENGSIYLLKKTQMNGAHAELFTYCLYKKVLEPAQKERRLKVLIPDYWESTSADDEPGVVLEHRLRDAAFSFSIKYDNGEYQITLLAPSADLRPIEVTALLQDLGYVEDNEHLSKTLSIDSIESAIINLDQRLAEWGSPT